VGNSCVSGKILQTLRFSVIVTKMDNMDGFFLGMRWQDIIDIMLMSYIIFRYISFSKATNVFTVLIGIALLWFFQRIASWLGLIVTSWAIQGVTGGRGYYPDSDIQK